MNDALIVSLLSIVPKNRTARWMGIGSRLRLPGFVHRFVLRWYVRHYRVNLDECVGGIEDYASLSEFFIRPLRSGVRPIDRDPDALVSPVDARAVAFGTITDGRFAVAPGKWCNLDELVGPESATRFEGGDFTVLYLAPPDYHRVHAPREGHVATVDYRPGRLWPVFPAATRRVQDLFARNERLVLHLDTELGRIAVVMVGAFGVGRMRTVAHDLVTNTGMGPTLAHLEPPLHLDRSDELGHFEMGSTVVLLLEPGQIEWELEENQRVFVGRRIARAR